MVKKESFYVCTQWWQRINDQTLQCQLCPHRCFLGENQRGFCGVRQNQNQTLVSLTYGRISSLCVDPIEKKPLYHFYPGSQVLSIGSIGCNLTCCFCQNWRIARSQAVDTLTEIDFFSIGETALKNKCRSVAFTYNEPVVCAEYVIDVFKECRKQKIKTVAVTNGYIQKQARNDFFKYVDAVNVDLKSFSDDFYQRLCQGQLQPVLDTLFFLLKETNIWVEITMLLIPGENDSDQEIDAMAQWVADDLSPNIPVHFSAFHPNFQMMNIKTTPFKTLHRARHIAMKRGLQFVYTGNIFDEQGTSTMCSDCGRRLIIRQSNQALCNHVQNAQCAFCNQKIPGCFTG